MSEKNLQRSSLQLCSVGGWGVIKLLFLILTLTKVIALEAQFKIDWIEIIFKLNWLIIIGSLLSNKNKSGQAKVIYWFKTPLNDNKWGSKHQNKLWNWKSDLKDWLIEKRSIAKKYKNEYYWVQRLLFPSHKQKRPIALKFPNQHFVKRLLSRQ